MAAVLAHLPFEAIDLLDHNNRNDDVICPEFEQRLGIEQKHVGIDDERFTHWA